MTLPHTTILILGTILYLCGAAFTAAMITGAFEMQHAKIPRLALLYNVVLWPIIFASTALQMVAKEFWNRSKRYGKYLAAKPEKPNE